METRLNRYRLTFTKNESMRYTSHLDLHHALDRTFRRARLPVVYSQGYNPRPRLNLASALPLGITSQGELAEVWLQEDLPPDEIQEALRDKSPPGLSIISVERAKTDTPKLPNQVQSAEYEALFTSWPVDLEARITSLLEADRLPRRRGEKSYDLRPLIEAMELRPGPDQGQLRLFIRLTARPGATGRADEVLDSLGIPLQDARLRRTRLILDT